ncbi:MAG: RICIN domain-containing protein [Mogibacterium sp.]|nr:RICIN domain-containing protein [Mogibacterium sp.]
MFTSKNSRGVRRIALVLMFVLFAASAVPISAATTAAVKEGTYEITSTLSGNRVVGLNGSAVLTRTRVAGGRNEDRFVLVSVGNGFYAVRNAKTGTVLDVTAGVKEIVNTASPGTEGAIKSAQALYKRNGGIRMSLTKYSGLAGQKWQLESAGSGYYYLKCYPFADYKTGPIAKFRNVPVYLKVANEKAGENVSITASVQIQIGFTNSGIIKKPVIILKPSGKSNALKFKLTCVETKTVTDKKNAFLKDTRWKNGTAWGARRPKLSTADGTGCYALCADYTKYVFGKNDPKSGKAFTKTNEIRSGDVLFVRNGKAVHWIIVLERNGSTLKTFERFDNKTSLATGRYNIKNGKLVNSKGAACSKQLVTGYHFQ